MYGKHFASMYEGSMAGKGALVFAVWGYVIAKMKPDRARNKMVVELHPAFLPLVFGEDKEDINRTITFLCSPDPDSRSPEHDGRRLLALGGYWYEVVNGLRYRGMQDEEQKRVTQCLAKRRQRARKSGKPLPGEKAYEQALRAGREDVAQGIEDAHSDDGFREVPAVYPGVGPGPVGPVGPIGIVGNGQNGVDVATGP